MEFSIHAQSFPAPKVRYTSFDINTGLMTIAWEPSASPDAVEYQVWYYYPDKPPVNGGWLEVGSTIPASGPLSLTFNPALLIQANPQVQPVVIGVQAYDLGGLSLNILDEFTFDSTLFLTAEHDSCQASINLTWNPFHFKQLTQPGTLEFHIYISEDNGISYQLVESISATEHNYQIESIAANQDYIVYVAAISANYSGEVANSNPVNLNTPMSVVPEYMYANYATYKQGWVDLSFTIDPLGELNTYNLLRSNAPNGTYNAIYTFETSEKELSYTDKVDFMAGPYYYQLEAENYCDTGIRQSDNLASTILLKRAGSELEPVFTWNEYVNFTLGTSHYQIERKFGDEPWNQLYNSLNTEFTDTDLASQVENNQASRVCYQLTAIENSGSNSSLSNPVCYDLPVNIRFEYDAFIPGSAENSSFGPTIDFIPDEYEFKIIDRSGRLVFESKDPSQSRWDGLIEGKLAPTGTYQCIVQYRIGDGSRRTLRGAVAVVY